MFKSYFWAGYECAYPLLRDGSRMDMLSDSLHDHYIREDYELIKHLGIKTVREGLSWSQIDKNGSYDFNRFEKFMHIAQEEGIQQIWDLNHFDYPEYLDPFSDELPHAFAKYAQAAIRIIRKYDNDTIYIVPINEISFFAWIGAEKGLWAPFSTNHGYALKKQLVRASIKAMDAIREIDDNVRFILVDPVMRRIAKKGTSNKQVLAEVEEFKILKFQSWDMLSGKLEPQLGGGPGYLDILGVNYYYHNQEWVLPQKDKDGEFRKWGIGWNTPNRVSLKIILEEVYQRYNRPMIITETGGWGDDRWIWWQRILKEVDESRSTMPIWGICAYPAVDRPDWDVKDKLTNSGLWDFVEGDVKRKRIPHQKTLNIIDKYIKRVTRQKKNVSLVNYLRSNQ